MIHAVTSEGRAVTLSQACEDTATVLVDWRADDTIDLGPALLQVLGDLGP